MKQNIRIAKELVRIAKSLIAEKRDAQAIKDVINKGLEWWIDNHIEKINPEQAVSGDKEKYDINKQTHIYDSIRHIKDWLDICKKNNGINDEEYKELLKLRCDDLKKYLDKNKFETKKDFENAKKQLKQTYEALISDLSAIKNEIEQNK